MAAAEAVDAGVKAGSEHDETLDESTGIDQAHTPSETNETIHEFDEEEDAPKELELPKRFVLLEMRKPGGCFCSSAWVPRYFASQKGYFGYFLDPESTNNPEALHSLWEPGVSVGLLPDGADGRPFVFQVQTVEEGHLYTIAAPDADERDAWVRDLAVAIATIQNGEQLTPTEQLEAAKQAGVAVSDAEVQASRAHEASMAEQAGDTVDTDDEDAERLDTHDEPLGLTSDAGEDEVVEDTGNAASQAVREAEPTEATATPSLEVVLPERASHDEDDSQHDNDGDGHDQASNRSSDSEDDDGDDQQATEPIQASQQAVTEPIQASQQAVTEPIQASQQAVTEPIQASQQAAAAAVTDVQVQDASDSDHETDEEDGQESKIAQEMGDTSQVQPDTMLDAGVTDSLHSRASSVVEPEAVPESVLRCLQPPPDEIPPSLDGSAPSHSPQQFVGHLLTHLWTRVRSADLEHNPPSRRAVREYAQSRTNTDLTGPAWARFVNAAVVAMVDHRLGDEPEPAALPQTLPLPGISTRVRLRVSRNSDEDDDIDDRMSAPSSAASLDMAVTTPMTSQHPSSAITCVPSMQQLPPSSQQVAEIPTSLAHTDLDSAVDVTAQLPAIATDPNPPTSMRQQSTDKPAQPMPSLGELLAIQAVQQAEPITRPSLVSEEDSVDASRPNELVPTETEQSQDPVAWPVMTESQPISAEPVGEASAPRQTRIRKGAGIPLHSPQLLTAVDDGQSSFQEAIVSEAVPAAASPHSPRSPKSAWRTESFSVFQADPSQDTTSSSLSERQGQLASFGASGHNSEGMMPRHPTPATIVEPVYPARSRSAETPTSPDQLGAEEAARNLAQDALISARRQLAKYDTSPADSSPSHRGSPHRSRTASRLHTTAAARSDSSPRAESQSHDHTITHSTLADSPYGRSNTSVNLLRSGPLSSPAGPVSGSDGRLSASALAASSPPRPASYPSAQSTYDAPADVLPPWLGLHVSQECKHPGFVGAMRELGAVAKATFNCFAAPLSLSAEATTAASAGQTHPALSLPSLHALSGATYLLAPPRLDRKHVDAVFNRLLAEPSPPPSHPAAVSSPNALEFRGFVAALVMFAVLRYPHDGPERFRRLLEEHLVPFATARRLINVAPPQHIPGPAQYKHPQEPQPQPVSAMSVDVIHPAASSPFHHHSHQYGLAPHYKADSALSAPPLTDHTAQKQPPPASMKPPPPPPAAAVSHPLASSSSQTKTPFSPDQHGSQASAIPVVGVIDGGWDSPSPVSPARRVKHAPKSLGGVKAGNTPTSGVVGAVSVSSSPVVPARNHSDWYKGASKRLMASTNTPSRPYGTHTASSPVAGPRMNDQRKRGIHQQSLTRRRSHQVPSIIHAVPGSTRSNKRNLRPEPSRAVLNAARRAVSASRDVPVRGPTHAPGSAGAAVEEPDDPLHAHASAATVSAGERWAVDSRGIRDALRADVTAVRGLFEYYALRWRQHTSRAGRPVMLSTHDGGATTWWISGREIEAFATEFALSPALMSRVAVRRVAEAVVADDIEAGGSAPATIAGPHADVMLSWAHFQELLARIALQTCARAADVAADGKAEGLSAGLRLLRVLDGAEAAKRVSMGNRGAGSLRFAARAIPVPGGK